MVVVVFVVAVLVDAVVLVVLVFVLVIVVLVVVAAGSGAAAAGFLVAAYRYWRDQGSYALLVSRCVLEQGVAWVARNLLNVY